MSPARLKPPLPLLMWFGLLGAPLGWAVQHMTGFSLTLATCGRALPGGAEVRAATGTGSTAVLDAWTIAATAAGTAITVLAGLAALSAFRATRGAAPDEEPPTGRIHFLAVVGLVITPLFLFIILMSGLSAVLFAPCQQA